MLLIFTHADGTTENVQVGQGETTPQRLGSFASNPIYITTPAGYTPVQGTLTAGSSAAFPILGTANGNYIGFYDGENKTLLVTKLLMDDSTAVTTGLATIAGALEAGDATLYMLSDGTAGS
jgi:hypothetical protein